MSVSYEEFLATKAQLSAGSGFKPTWLPDYLFPVQRYLVDWAIHMGRGAVYADCGLGKSPIELVWAQNVRQKTGKPVLLATPLGVTFQMVEEAQKFGVNATISRDGTPVGDVTVTNYERLERFDPDDFGGTVCDESSAIKSYEGKRREIVTEFLRTQPYRLLGTATAAPNDYTELGTSSEALGHLGYMDMLSRFFTNRERTSRSMYGRWKRRGGEEWRFKGHAEEAFWQWVSSWARAVRKPSDLGFGDDGFALPPLDVRRHVIRASMPKEGTLFDVVANGLHEEREEARRTIQERCERCADLLTDADPGVAWCQLNDESTLLTKLIPGAVEITGSMSPDEKEEKLAAFSRNEIRVLVIKPSIGAWGLNWQHCNRMTYIPSHSYEQWYQSIRRCWRFGQTKTVQVDVVTTEGGVGTLKNLERKAIQADRMFTALTTHMRNALTIQRGADYETPVEVPTWAAS